MRVYNKIMDRKKSDHFSKIHHLNRWKKPWNTNSDDSTAGSHLRYLRSLYAFCKHPKLWREKAGWTSFRAGEVSTPRITRMLRLAHKVLNTLANEPIKSIDTHIYIVQGFMMFYVCESGVKYDSRIGCINIYIYCIPADFIVSVTSDWWRIYGYAMIYLVNHRMLRKWCADGSFV